MSMLGRSLNPNRSISLPKGDVVLKAGCVGDVNKLSMYCPQSQS